MKTKDVEAVKSGKIELSLITVLFSNDCHEYQLTYSEGALFYVRKEVSISQRKRKGMFSLRFKHTQTYTRSQYRYMKTE